MRNFRLAYRITHGITAAVLVSSLLLNPLKSYAQEAKGLKAPEERIYVASGGNMVRGAFYSPGEASGGPVQTDKQQLTKDLAANLKEMTKEKSTRLPNLTDGKSEGLETKGRTAKDFAPKIAEGLLNSITAQPEADVLRKLGIDKETLDAAKEACKRVKNGTPSSDMDYVISLTLYTAFSLSYLEDKTENLADIEKTTKLGRLALASVREKPAVVPERVNAPDETVQAVPKLQLLDQVKNLPTEMELELTQAKFKPNQNFDLVLQRLARTSDAEKSDLIPQLKAALKAFEAYGFAASVPAYTPDKEFEAYLDTVAKSWNNAKQFVNGVQILIGSGSLRDLVDYLEGVPDGKRFQIALFWVNRMLNAHQLDPLTGDKRKAIKELEKLGEKLKGDSAEGNAKVAKFVDDAKRAAISVDANGHVIDNRTQLEKEAFDSIRTLPFFASVAFQKAYNNLVDKQLLVDSTGAVDLAKLYIVNSMAKLSKFDPTGTLLALYLEYAVVEIADRSNGVKDVFNKAMGELDRQIQQICGKYEDIEAMAQMKRFSIVLRLGEAFIRAQSIPRNVLDRYGKDEALGEMVTQEARKPMNYRLRPTGIYSDIFDIGPMMPTGQSWLGNFGFANPNQIALRFSGGGGVSERSISGIDIGPSPIHSYAAEQLAAVDAHLSSGVSTKTFGVEQPGSLIGALGEQALIDEIHKMFLSPRETQYSITPEGGYGAFGAQGGDKAETLFGGAAQILTPTGSMGLSGYKQNMGQTVSGLVLVATGIPIGLVKDIGMSLKPDESGGFVLNTHSLGGGFQKREGGDLNETQLDWATQLWASVATKKDEDGNLKNPGALLGYVFGGKDRSEGDVVLMLPQENGEVKIMRVYGGQDSQVALFNYLGGSYRDSYVTAGINMVAPELKGFYSETQLEKTFPDYVTRKQELTGERTSIASQFEAGRTGMATNLQTLTDEIANLHQMLNELPADSPYDVRQQFIDELNNKKMRLEDKQHEYDTYVSEGRAVDSIYAKQLKDLEDEYRKKLRLNMGGVIAVNLPKEWVKAEMFTTVPGMQGERRWAEWTDVTAKTFQSSAAWGEKGKATLILGFPGVAEWDKQYSASPEEKASPRSFTQSGYVRWVERKFEVNQPIPEAWDLTVMGGGGKTTSGDTSGSGGFRLRYQTLGAGTRVGGSFSYTRMDSAAQMSQQQAELQDIKDRLKYGEQYFGRVYYSTHLPDILVGTLANILVEKREFEGSKEDQAYWKGALVLKAVDDTYGIRIMHSRYSGMNIAMQNLEATLGQIAADPQRSQELMSNFVSTNKKFLDQVFQEGSLEVVWQPNARHKGMVEFRINTTDKNYKMDDIQTVSGKAVLEFKNPSSGWGGHVRGTVTYQGEAQPIVGLNTTNASAEKVGWASVGGGFVAPSDAFHRFSADLIMQLTGSKVTGMGTVASLAVYETAAQGYYLALTALFPDYDVDKMRLTAGFMGEVASKAKFYAIFDHSRKKISFTSDEVEVKNAVYAGASAVVYQRGGVTANLDIIGGINVAEPKRPAAATSLYVDFGGWGFEFAAALQSSMVDPLTPQGSPLGGYMPSFYLPGEYLWQFGLSIYYGRRGGLLNSTVPAHYEPLQQGYGRGSLDRR